MSTQNTGDFNVAMVKVFLSESFSSHRTVTPSFISKDQKYDDIK